MNDFFYKVSTYVFYNIFYKIKLQPFRIYEDLTLSKRYSRQTFITLSKSNSENGLIHNIKLL